VTFKTNQKIHSVTFKEMGRLGVNSLFLLFRYEFCETNEKVDFG